MDGRTDGHVLTEISRYHFSLPMVHRYKYPMASTMIDFVKRETSSALRFDCFWDRFGDQEMLLVTTLEGKCILQRTMKQAEFTCKRRSEWRFESQRSHMFLFFAVHFLSVLYFCFVLFFNHIFPCGLFPFVFTADALRLREVFAITYF